MEMPCGIRHQIERRDHTAAASKHAGSSSWRPIIFLIKFLNGIAGRYSLTLPLRNTLCTSNLRTQRFVLNSEDCRCSGGTL